MSKKLASYQRGYGWNPSTYAVAVTGSTWSNLPMSVKQNWNLLCAQAVASGYLNGQTRPNAYTLFTQMRRAVRTVYGDAPLSDAPEIVSLPPSIPAVTVTATVTGGRLSVLLSGPAYGGGVQVMASAPFVPGGPNPLGQRASIIGALPDGWDTHGVDLSDWYAGKHGTAPVGADILVKLTPVSRDGFVGPSWCQVVPVE